MKMFQSVQWLTSMAFPIQHFGNALLAKSMSFLFQAVLRFTKGTLIDYLFHSVGFGFSKMEFFLGIHPSLEEISDTSEYQNWLQGNRHIPI